MTRRTITAAVAALGLLLGLIPSADAVHFYRSNDGGCQESTGDVGEGATEDQVDHEVVLGHNTFHDTSNGTPVTRVEVGDTVRWVWSSSHCHSVEATANESGEKEFDSGFHYPADAPHSPQAIPGFFEYPAPDPSPTLSFTHTFEEPGTYQYFCVHHGAIGMVGAVQVTEGN